MNILNAKVFRDSSKELTKLQSLTICAMMLALRVVLGYFSNITLAITPDIKIGFNFLPIAITGILCGPVPAMIVGGLGDLLSFLIAPMGFYFPGWTASGILVGLLYGLFLYKSKCSLLSITICEVIIGIFVEIALGSLWLLIQYDKAFFIMAGVRGLKTLVATPVEIAVVFFFSKVLRKVPKLKFK
ncbi:MAG: folate family ECF transporter S component [Ruminococcus sp.]|nr:folate family ECF transporter S component [Ruminococcus sp.]